VIRGSIEVARRTQVSGWIYADTGTVRDRLILAFSGDRCVGAGKVDHFRRDLLEAELGDGYCGFDFAIKLNDDEAVASVIVRLQNSDAALIQRESILIGAGEETEEEEEEEETDLGAIPPARVSWMQDRGWLEQHEYDFLRAVQTVGAYERGLRPARRANVEAPSIIKPEQIAQDLLSLYAMADVDLTRTKLASISDLAQATSPIYKRGLSVVALWSTERCRIVLDERSHINSVTGHGVISLAPAPGAIEYSFGPDRILFLHRQASFAPDGFAPRDGISVFTAAERGSAMAGRLIRRGRAA
jgi:hypothetical protein